MNLVQIITGHVTFKSCYNFFKKQMKAVKNRAINFVNQCTRALNGSLTPRESSTNETNWGWLHNVVKAFLKFIWLVLSIPAAPLARHGCAWARWDHHDMPVRRCCRRRRILLSVIKVRGLAILTPSVLSWVHCTTHGQIWPMHSSRTSFPIITRMLDF